ncbi:MAG: GGDEF domain-containing protein [Oscillospiraceae bacterium]|nr:GGDEF domain-containing protein [Oscillospiraceae bacterium]
MSGGALQEFLDEIGSEGEDLLLLVSETAELVDYYRRLLERLELDSLTGLPGANKYHAYTATLESHSKTVGMLFFDVNDLKYYNDNKGHHAGDLLLQKAAESLIMISEGNVRSFRLGGDEFVTIITNCKEKDLDYIISKWREALAELNTRDDGIHCSVSVGAAFGASGYKLAEVLEDADKRMYEDKVRIKAARGQKPR